MNLKSILLWAFIALINPALFAQEILKLWDENEKPFYKRNSLNEYEQEAYNTMCVYNVTEPTLTIYNANGKNTGKAVLIIPGGGYGLVAMYHEGYDVAKALAEKGITAAVLKYRLPNPQTSDNPEKVPLADARKALEILHKKAFAFGINPKKIGVMGFSAGSHLATVLTLWKSKNPDENPDFSVLVYGVTQLNDENLKWLEESLYFRKLTPEEIKQNTLLNLVNDSTPPAFLVHAYDDNICKVEETTLYAQQLFEHQIPVEVHLFTKGGHGFGLGRKEDGTDPWISLFVNWLNNNF